MNRNTWLVLSLGALFASSAYSCSVIGRISGATMFSQADVIIRAKAINAVTQPSRTGDGTVRFQTLETIRGAATNELLLPGTVVDFDDWNDKPAPYDFVRTTGREGSCFTDFYREGAEYLLFLKKDKDGSFTTHWYALGPVNEQLHSDIDPWLLWTRDEQRKLQGK